ncbi:MAG: CBS domain-containing protein [Hyphomicrobiales bacterium]|nr:CBS domain-containing protein [Hyphomicrobiales bacterium]
MKAADVMVTKVVTVGPDASVQDIAEILLSNRISGVPVVGAQGELLGIVSEGDLLRRVEAGTGRRRPWWLAIFIGKEALAAEFVKEHARKVRDVMTHHVVTASPDAALSEIADLLEKNAIKRVPIVRDGRVVGIVSRANLLQALAGRAAPSASRAPEDDAKIRDAVLAQLNAEPWARPTMINVIVQDGTVELWGVVDSASEKAAVRVTAEGTPGVRAVTDNLVVRPVESGY